MVVVELPQRKRQGDVRTNIASRARRVGNRVVARQSFFAKSWHAFTFREISNAACLSQQRLYKFANLYFTFVTQKD
jgi:hypothetical protein